MLEDLRGDVQRDAENLRFFGRVTAGVTHELNNVMSIIDQAAGALQDQCDMAGNQPLPAEKVRHAIARLTRQVERGVEIIKNLNAFAHSPDEPSRQLDLNEETRLMIALGGRWAARQKVKIEFSPSANAALIVSSPFPLKRFFWAALQATLASTETDGFIRVQVQPQAENTVLQFTGSPAKISELPAALGEELTVLADSLCGRWTAKSENSTAIVELMIPNLPQENCHERRQSASG